MSQKDDNKAGEQADDLFQQAMGDVKPINASERVVLTAKKDAGPGLDARRRAAQEEELVDNNTLSGEYVEPVDPLDILTFKRPGVQDGVYRKLRLGKYPLEARLDLHHKTVEAARQAVFQFVGDCHHHDIRCAIITHGKGQDRRPQPALLKSCVAHWLPQLEQILAFHSALKQHGGVGATYILLRKSERKRQENLEMHQKRRN